MVDGWRRFARFLSLCHAIQPIYFTLRFNTIYKGEIEEEMPEKNEKINSLMQTSAENLDMIADVNTVMGQPIITASGFQIIPFSKVTMGNLSGGGEYGDVKVVKKTDAFPLAGGSGAVISMKPMGFLIDDGKTCNILRITEEPLDNLIERASEIMRDVFSKD